MQDYATSDTPLAAYLISKGFELKDIKRKKDKSHFIFPNSDPSIEKAVFEFQSSTAEGNINIFFNAYRYLLRRMREDN